MTYQNWIPGNIIIINGCEFFITKADCYKSSKWIRQPNSREVFWLRRNGVTYMLTGSNSSAIVRRIATTKEHEDSIFIQGSVSFPCEGCAERFSDAELDYVTGLCEICAKEDNELIAIELEN